MEKSTQQLLKEIQLQLSKLDGTVENVTKLKQGQEEILIQLDRIEKKLS